MILLTAEQTIRYPSLHGLSADDQQLTVDLASRLYDWLNAVGAASHDAMLGWAASHDVDATKATRALTLLGELNLVFGVGQLIDAFKDQSPLAGVADHADWKATVEGPKGGKRVVKVRAANEDDALEAAQLHVDQELDAALDEETWEDQAARTIARTDRRSRAVSVEPA